MEDFETMDGYEMYEYLLGIFGKEEMLDFIVTWLGTDKLEPIMRDMFIEQDMDIPVDDPQYYDNIRGVIL